MKQLLKIDYLDRVDLSLIVSFKNLNNLIKVSNGC